MEIGAGYSDSAHEECGASPPREVLGCGEAPQMLRTRDDYSDRAGEAADRMPCLRKNQRDP